MVVEHGQVGEPLLLRGGNRQVHRQVDTVEVEFRHVFEERREECGGNPLLQRPAPVGKAPGLKTERPAVGFAHPFVRPGLEMIAETRVAHAEATERRVDPQRVPAMGLTSVGPLDDVVVIDGQSHAPQRIGGNAGDLGTGSARRSQVIRRTQLEFHRRLVDHLVVHPPEGVLQRLRGGVPVRAGLLQRTDRPGEELAVGRHPVLRLLVPDPVGQHLLAELVEGEVPAPRVSEHFEGVVDVPDQKTAVERRCIELGPDAARPIESPGRPPPQLLPRNRPVAEQRVVIGTETFHPRTSVTVMQRHVLDQEAGRAVFERVGLVRSVMPQHRLQLRTVVSGQTQCRLQRGVAAGDQK